MSDTAGDEICTCGTAVTADKSPGKSKHIPPHALFRNFLPDEAADTLLDWAVANEARFLATRVGVGDRARIDTEFRRSVGVRGFGPIEDKLRRRSKARAAELIASVGINQVEIGFAELELIAHGDGAFYGRHIDTFAPPDTGESRARVLSAVYYVFRRPKGFSGGALRLHAFTSPLENHDWVDIEPEHNALLVFPSWAPHEVRPVACPSRQFAASRFAVNIWLYKQTKPPAGAV